MYMTTNVHNVETLKIITDRFGDDGQYAAVEILIVIRDAFDHVSNHKMTLFPNKTGHIELDMTGVSSSILSDTRAPDPVEII
jgi:hypothetical protein